MNFATEQEAFWSGNFGNHYIDRNKEDISLSSNISFFSKILNRTQNILHVLELGSNIGLNLQAIKALVPSIKLSAIEINQKATQELLHYLPDAEVFHTSILGFEPLKTWDLVFTKGVLIHINPDQLPTVYNLMYQSSSRYILVCEYYNPQPVEILYRGHSGKLFKRDFAGEMMDMFSDLRLLDYGFTYHRDPSFPQDDLNWFLLEKSSVKP